MKYANLISDRYGRHQLRVALSRWLEGGLVSCPEKLIMDADQLAMLQIFQGGIDLTENGQALDAI